MADRGESPSTTPQTKLDLTGYTTQGSIPDVVHASALKVLRAEREELAAALVRIDAAIAALKAQNSKAVRTPPKGKSLAGAAGVNGDFGALNIREAATAVLRQTSPLTGGELRAKMERAGKVVAYRYLYNTLKARTTVFRQLPDKRWALIGEGS